jgi:thiosulfate dehydrogenase (quinone) large subunit
LSANTQTGRAEIPEPNVTRFLFADTRMAPVWLILRLWLGYEWLQAAWGKWPEGG